MRWTRKVRSTISPSKVELDYEVIPELEHGSFRNLSAREMALAGTVVKTYVSFGDPFAPGTVGYIAKKAKRAGDLECVTEEMICSLGRLLPLRMADSRLVRLPTSEPGTYDLRFMSRNFLVRGVTALVHGLELMAGFMESTTEEIAEVFLRNREEERSFYTTETVVHVLRWFGRDDAERHSLIDAFGRMLAFDALLGAQDRHAMNWGVIQHLREPRVPYEFAPLFDTARGLFCEHREKSLEDMDRRGERRTSIERYAARSVPVLGCSCSSGKKLNHFELIEHCIAEQASELKRPIEQVVGAFGLQRAEKMLKRRFGRIITSRRMGYVLELLELRAAKLKSIVETAQ